MDDVISRQAAITQLSHNKNKGDDEWELAVENDIQTIWKLPSALGTNLAEVGTDCISRQAAIDALNHELRCGAVINQCGLEMAYEVIEDLPPAQSDIIYCKDCKHWIPYDWMFSEVWQSRNIADYPEDEMGCKWCDMSMKANDFCSRAERREVTT